jgi:RNA polymerase sigma factor (sigma-70 family)
MSDQDSRHARANSLATDPAVGDIMRAAVKRAARQAPSLSDEFEAEAWVALWVAATRYDPGSHVKWPHYLNVKLRNSLKDFRRKWTQVRPDSKSKPVALSMGGPEPGGGNELASTIADVASDEPPVGRALEAREESDLVAHALARLEEWSPRQAQVLGQLYGVGGCDPVTPLELGRRLGVTGQSVNTTRLQGMKNMRKIMRDMEGTVAG